MTEDQFMARFEAGVLPEQGFHHRDHVQLAWLYLRRFGALESLRRLSEGLARVAQARGRPQVYHETITWAYVLLIRERMARTEPVQDWQTFAQANADLLEGKDGILGRYYCKETLGSDLARRVFLFPDRAIHLPGAEMNGRD
jgi:hypothetical protein